MWEELEKSGIKPYYKDDAVFIIHIDCREVLPLLPNKYVSAIVCDPPYELGFMGKAWDKKGISFQPDIWQLIRDACLPGAPLLSFGGTRTSHRIACAIEDAGWQIRDTICWVYGQGFPKSLDVSKAIDKNNGKPNRSLELEKYLTINIKEKYDNHQRLAIEMGIAESLIRHWIGKCGTQFLIPTLKQYTALREKLNLDNRFDWLIEWEEAKREVIGEKNYTSPQSMPLPVVYDGQRIRQDITIPSTPEAKLWEGYGTGLKPAYEPIILAMNPLDGTFANNALKHKVAGLNIDGCRIGIEERTYKGSGAQPNKLSNHERGDTGIGYADGSGKDLHFTVQGRFPANFILGYPEDEYELREGITTIERENVVKWLYENT